MLNYVTVGGYDAHLDAQGTSYIYAVEKSRWIHRTSLGSSTIDTYPLSRSFHTATLVELDSESYLFVIGGLHVGQGHRGPDGVTAARDR